MNQQEERLYGEKCYNLLFEIIGNKKNTVLLDSFRGENAVLTFLAQCKKPVHAGVLSEELSLVPGRMTDILKSLEKKQMILREKDSYDRRKVLVSITKTGLDYVIHRRDQIRDRYCGLYETLGQEDTLKLIDLLSRVNSYFDSI